MWPRHAAWAILSNSVQQLWEAAFRMHTASCYANVTWLITLIWLCMQAFRLVPSNHCGRGAYRALADWMVGTPSYLVCFSASATTHVEFLYRKPYFHAFHPQPAPHLRGFHCSSAPLLGVQFDFNLQSQLDLKYPCLLLVLLFQPELRHSF